MVPERATGRRNGTVYYYLFILRFLFISFLTNFDIIINRIPVKIFIF